MTNKLTAKIVFKNLTDGTVKGLDIDVTPAAARKYFEGVGNLDVIAENIASKAQTKLGYWKRAGFLYNMEAFEGDVLEVVASALSHVGEYAVGRADMTVHLPMTGADKVLVEFAVKVTFVERVFKTVFLDFMDDDDEYSPVEETAAETETVDAPVQDAAPVTPAVKKETVTPETISQSIRNSIAYYFDAHPVVARLDAAHAAHKDALTDATRIEYHAALSVARDYMPLRKEYDAAVKTGDLSKILSVFLKVDAKVTADNDAATVSKAAKLIADTELVSKIRAYKDAVDAPMQDVQDVQDVQDAPLSDYDRAALTATAKDAYDAACNMERAAGINMQQAAKDLRRANSFTVNRNEDWVSEAETKLEAAKLKQVAAHNAIFMTRKAWTDATEFEKANRSPEYLAALEALAENGRVNVRYNAELRALVYAGASEAEKETLRAEWRAASGDRAALQAAVESFTRPPVKAENSPRVLINLAMTNLGHAGKWEVTETPAPVAPVKAYNPLINTAWDKLTRADFSYVLKGLESLSDEELEAVRQERLETAPVKAADGFEDYAAGCLKQVEQIEAVQRMRVKFRAARETVAIVEPEEETPAPVAPAVRTGLTRREQIEADEDARDYAAYLATRAVVKIAPATSTALVVIPAPVAPASPVVTRPRAIEAAPGRLAITALPAAPVEDVQDVDGTEWDSIEHLDFISELEALMDGVDAVDGTEWSSVEHEALIEELTVLMDGVEDEAAVDATVWVTAIATPAVYGKASTSPLKRAARTLATILTRTAGRRSARDMEPLEVTGSIVNAIPYMEQRYRPAAV